MTSGAGRREARRLVVRVLRVVEIVDVARSTVHRRSSEFAVDMTLLARHGGVHAGQRKFGERIVIEPRALPARSGMANAASRWEPRRLMVRVLRAVEILGVAGGTVCRRPREFAVDVALLARHAGVRAGQRKLGEHIVIEPRALPAHRGVALRAILRKTRPDVIRVLCGVEIFPMAAEAIGRGALKAPTGVARRAFQLRVNSSEHESGELRVVELGALPGVHRMAGLAGGRKLQSGMARRFGLLKRLDMTGRAFRRQSGKPAGRRALVARLARDYRMRAHQREPVLVALDCLLVHLPAAHGVTPITVGPKLTAVHIGVAIGASRTDIGKDQLYMAAPALHVLVHAAQRVARRVVIELGNAAYRLPTGERVTVFAGDGDRPVRVAGGSSLRALGSRLRRRGKREHPK